MPASSRKGPAAPCRSGPLRTATGVPWPMPEMTYCSSSSSPPAFVHTRREWPSTNSSRLGTAANPWTSAHCLMISAAFTGATVRSALPCQTDSLGHGPRCRRRPSHQIAPRPRRPNVALEHAPEGGGHADCAAIGHTGDHGAAREHLGVGRQHNRRHPTPRREAGNEHPAAVDRMGLDHVLDHVPDRERLTLAALAVTALKPVEAASRVVGALLLGEEQG